MFLADSEKANSDLVLETDSEIKLQTLLEKVCDGDEALLFKLIDEQKNLRPHVNIFIGNQNCRKLKGIETSISPQDEVTVFPSLSGG